MKQSQAAMDLTRGRPLPQILRFSLPLVGTPADIFADARTYILIMFAGIPAAMLYNFASGALRVFMASAFIYGVQSCCQSTFVALGNAPASLFLAIYRKFILLIPLIFILPHFFADKTFAVYLAQPISDFIAAFTTAAVFFYQFRKLSAKFQEPSTRA